MNQPQKSESEFQSILITDLLRDELLQMRISMNGDHVASLAERIADDQELPAPTVFITSDDEYLLADGFHTVEAHVSNEMSSVICRVLSGERLDAIRYAAQANHDHGLPRTQGDLVKAFETLVRKAGLNPTDNVETRRLLCCSQRRADQLTKGYRDAQKQRQQERSQVLVSQGGSLSEVSDLVAKETGQSFSVDQVRAAVGNTSVGFQHSAEIPPRNKPDDAPRIPSAQSSSATSGHRGDTNHSGIADSVVRRTPLEDEFDALIGQFRDLATLVAEYRPTAANIQTISQGIALLRTMDRD